MQSPTKQTASLPTLRSRREERGCSVEQLSIITGLTVAELNLLEKGAQHPDHVARVEHALS